MEITNNILAERLDGLKDLFNNRFIENDRAHQEMLEQVKKTNGRTTVIENWKNKIIGAIIITNVLLLPVLFIIVKNWLEKK